MKLRNPTTSRDPVLPICLRRRVPGLSVGSSTPLRSLRRRSAIVGALVLLLPIGPSALAANYDEDKVPEYVLPDPLEGVSGAEDWAERRTALLARFESQMFGVAPPGEKADLKVERSGAFPVLEGRADAITAVVTMAGQPVQVLVVLPHGRSGPVPVILGLNFLGNHSLLDDPRIPLPKARREDGRPIPSAELEELRGTRTSRWPLELIVGSGHALVTAYYGEIDPDFDDGFRNGVHAAFPPPGDGDWGSIAAWAWGLSRIMDTIASGDLTGDLDPERVAVFGHSRLGKTALWAGARDERFGLVISNNSGCGGAALSRRAFGETVARINTSFPHWFCRKFRRYNDNESALPIDQHELLALIAPRAVYVASAEDDRWADPRGEFLACVHASPVYELLGEKGVGADEQPAPGESLTQGRIAYHVRPGKHDVTRYDWEQYLAYANRLWQTR